MENRLVFAGERPPPGLRRRRLPETAFLYVIECRGFVKVGVAGDVRSRVSSLQVGCPYTLDTIATYPLHPAISQLVERRVHEALAPDAHQGEWFTTPVDRTLSVVADVVQRIETEAIAQFGSLDAITWALR